MRQRRLRPFQNKTCSSTAEKLVSFKGTFLSFNGLKHLDVATAEKLVSFNGREIQLSRLKYMDAAIIEMLKGYNGDLCGNDGQ